MSGSLILIDSATASTSATVTLGGADWDNSYDVYMVTYYKVQPVTDAVNLQVRFTVSGTADSSANYDRAFLKLNSGSSFSDITGTDGNQLRLSAHNTGTGTNEFNNGVLYLFNFNDASEYSFITSEETGFGADTVARGNMGGGVLTVAQATDGILFKFSSGNISSGEFKLYGLKK